MRKIAVISFFAIQFLIVLIATQTDQKYFAWVPYDEIAKYEIAVKLNGEELSPDQVRQRYKIPKSGYENRSIAHLFSFLSQYEMTYGKDENASVEVIYSINGKDSKKWTLQN